MATGRKRKQTGGFKARLLQKETEAKLKEMRGATVKYKKHRPVGNLQISVLRGRHLVPHHGIPGSLVCSFAWDPLKFVADKDARKDLIECDPSSSAVYQIGATEGSGVTSSPEWNIVHGSNELERMRQLLPSKNFLSRTHSSADLNSDMSSESKQSSETVLHFPILQPIAPSGQNPDTTDEDDEEGMPQENVEILPWVSSKGAIVVQVRFADVLNKLPIFDQVVGDVVIPFSRIAKDRRVEGWFQVLEKGTLRTVEQPKDDGSNKICISEDGSSLLNRLIPPGTDAGGTEASPKEEKGQPFIYLKAELTIPSRRAVNDIDRETSIVVAEHLMRSAASKADSGFGFLGTSINTFNTVTGVRGNVQSLQNQLGNMLDIVDIVRNTFNFTVRCGCRISTPSPSFYSQCSHVYD